MQDGNVLLIANPAAQRGNGARAAQIAHDLLCEWIGPERVTLALTERPQHAVELASAASADAYPSVIALGGDGIVHETVNGLMRIDEAMRPRFGVIPVGSGNDYARTLGMSECVPDAIVQFLDAREVPMDVGCSNGEHFVETLSFGLDAAIALDTVERRERTGEQGTPLYLKSGLNQLLRHLDTYWFEAILAGGTRLGGAIHLLTVQIGPTYGGGFRICPEADPTDGVFDLCYASAPMSVPGATYKFLRAKNAHHTKLSGIHFARTSALKLAFDRRPPCQIDGEPHVADSFDISIDQGALRVLTPANTAARA